MSRHYGPGYHHFRKRARWEFYHLLDERDREAKRRKKKSKCSGCALLNDCPYPNSGIDQSKCFVRSETKRKPLTDEERVRLKQSRLYLEKLRKTERIAKIFTRSISCLLLIGGIIGSSVLGSPVAFFFSLVGAAVGFFVSL